MAATPVLSPIDHPRRILRCTHGPPASRLEVGGEGRSRTKSTETRPL